jgi:hypothetical protein
MRVKQQRIRYEYLGLRLPFPWKQTGMGLRCETREGLANLAKLGAGAPSRWSRRHPLARTVLDGNAQRRLISIKALGRTTAVLLSPQKTVGTLMRPKMRVPSTDFWALLRGQPRVGSHPRRFKQNRRRWEIGAENRVRRRSMVGSALSTWDWTSR